MIAKKILDFSQRIAKKTSDSNQRRAEKCNFRQMIAGVNTEFPKEDDLDAEK